MAARRLSRREKERFERLVRGLKSHPDSIDNPYALARWLVNETHKKRRRVNCKWCGGVHFAGSKTRREHLQLARLARI